MVTVEIRDLYTACHQRRVAELASAIAQEMGFTPESIETLKMTALIHDLGKISVPVEFLTMPWSLTEVEFTLFKPHAEADYNILKDIDCPWPIARMIMEYHERVDGSGYPQGIMSGEMLDDAKIIAMADVVKSNGFSSSGLRH